MVTSVSDNPSEAEKPRSWHGRGTTTAAYPLPAGSRGQPGFIQLAQHTLRIFIEHPGSPIPYFFIPRPWTQLCPSRVLLQGGSSRSTSTPWLQLTQGTQRHFLELKSRLEVHNFTAAMQYPPIQQCCSPSCPYKLSQDTEVIFVISGSRWDYF